MISIIKHTDKDKMKPTQSILILLSLLLLFSCDNPEEPVIKGCITDTACNYNADATKDDGSCLENDCDGECGGNAVIDECDVCNGNGIADGACDCDGNTEDCDNVCGGSAVIDECGVCNIDQPIGPYQCCDGFIPNCNSEYNGGEGIKECCPIRWIGDNLFDPFTGEWHPIGPEECDGALQPHGCDLRCYDCAWWEDEGEPVEEPTGLQDLCIDPIYCEDYNSELGICNDADFNEDGGDCECVALTVEWCTPATLPQRCGIWSDECGGEIDCEGCSEEGMWCNDETGICWCGDDVEACCAGYVPNCDPDHENAEYNCCPEEWIGDGLCDNECQPFGCDLTCYGGDPYPDGEDGGDCSDDCPQPDCEAMHLCGDWGTAECGCFECGECSGINEGLECGEDGRCR